jgi:hypothetical protein
LLSEEVLLGVTVIHNVRISQIYFGKDGLDPCCLIR